MTAAPAPTRRRLLRAGAAIAASGGVVGVPLGAGMAQRAAGEGGRGFPPGSLATGPAPSGTLLPLPPPCTERPGDILGLLLEGLGSPAGCVTVFGQVFRPGDLPRDSRLSVRRAGGGGQAIPVQADVTTRHPDGSARFAVVSLRLPVALAPGQRLGILLAAAGRAGGAAEEPPLDLAAALAGRQAVIELSAGGGQPWLADLLALLARPEAAARAWQSGPLAVQRRVALEVPAAAAGGVTSLRLVADVALRADGTLWVDAWLRNDAAMRAGGGAAEYGMRLLLDGVEALRADRLRHHQYTGWGRLLAAAPGGRPAAPPPVPRPNAAYLAETGAVAPYDLSTGVDPGILRDMRALMAAPAWQAPFAPRGITQGMPTTGGRRDIGPMTDWQAAWLISGDPLAAAFCIGQAEAAGAIPWHFWDPGSGPRGGWLNHRRWPRLWTDSRGGPPPRGLLQPVPTDTGWDPDHAHQPDLCFLPYLMTGRPALLDGLLAQASFNIVGVWPEERNPPGISGHPAADAILAHRRQVRAAAWGLRQLDEAAWTCPEAEADRAWVEAAARGNWAWLRAQIPAWTSAQGEAHGWLPGESRDASLLAPWSQDYLAAVAAASARRGSDDARAVLAWMANFLVGRFRAADRGMARNDGVAFQIAIAPGRAGAAPFRSWAEIGAAMRERGLSNGAGWERSQGDYAMLGMQSLAQLVDVLGMDSAREALIALVQAKPPHALPLNFARNPAFNIVPRGTQRYPSSSTGCAAPR